MTAIDSESTKLFYDTAATLPVADDIELVRFFMKASAPAKSLRYGVLYQGQAAGSIGIYHRSGTIASIDCNRSRFPGRGIATVALKAFCDFAFEEFGLEYLEFRIADTNLPSQALAARIEAEHVFTDPYGFQTWLLAKEAVNA